MSWIHHRACVATLTRDRSPGDPDLVDARRQVDAALLAARAHRAADDPAPVARAACIVRAVLARPWLTLASLAPSNVDGGDVTC